MNRDRIKRAKARAGKGGKKLTSKEIEDLYAREPRDGGTKTGAPASPLERRIQRRQVRS